MNNSTSFRTLIEKISAEKQVYKIKLPVKESALSGVFSKDALDLHYGTLYGNYVKKALAGEGEFQVAGAKLHTLFFEQFKEVTRVNNPVNEIKDLIEEKFGSYKEFREQFIKEALTIHGSGWCYLDTKGAIKTIVNHKDIDNIALLVDMWEHSYLLDYGADKEKYLKNIWQIIDWGVINNRL